jgi:hypothetical protein
MLAAANAHTANKYDRYLPPPSADTAGLQLIALRLFVKATKQHLMHGVDGVVQDLNYLI